MNNFLIVGTQRTGSSALAEAIGFHPEIACGWESTLHVGWHRRFTVAEQFFKGDFRGLPERERIHMSGVYGPDVQWLGFRRLFSASNKWLVQPGISPALWSDRFQAHLKWIARQPLVRIIHIVRRDNIAWLKSKFFSRKSSLYVGKQYPGGMQVTIPIGEAVARIKSKHWVDSQLAGLGRTNHYIRVFYEGFLQDKSEAVADIVRFLECDPRQLGDIDHKGRQKQSRGAVSDGIVNYAELVEVLRREQLQVFNAESLDEEARSLFENS